MVHISLSLSLHHCLNSDFRAWPWMLQGEGTWGTADIPPGGIWRVGLFIFWNLTFKWNALALIFQHAQVSEMPKPMSRTSLSVPQSALRFPGRRLVPTGCKFFRAGSVECGKTSTVALVPLISFVKDRILMWHYWRSMLNDFCDKVLLGKANCVEGKCDHCSVYST